LREEVYRIIGMHCATCAITIQKSLSKLGIEALVSLASEEARIKYDPSKVTPRDIVNAIRKAGYDVYKEEAIAIVKNLNSYDDEKIIVERLRNLEGVIEVHASHIDKSVRILYNPLVIKQQSLAEALGSLGYSVESFKAEAEVEDIGSKVAIEDLKKLRLYTLISLPASILLAIYYMLGYMGYPVPLWGSPLLRDLLVGIPLSTIVLFIGSMRFLRTAIRSFLNLNPGMDSLVILGTYSAYIFSLAVTLGLVKGEAFYEASAVVMAFILLGRYIEARLKLRTGEAVKKLAQLQSRSARVVRGGVEAEIPIEDVRIGDLVRIKPGERIPVDGIVKEGSGYVDESAMTGEPNPVEKSPGDPVYAGTTVLRGSLLVYTTRVGKDTVLGQIIRLVRIAQNSRPKIQGTVDRVAGIFTWIVIAIAISTLAYWTLLAGVPLSTAIIFVASVLVIACPCALGLATPAAIVTGFGRGAELGVLIKDASVIDRVHRIKTVVFDKTGTLTVGKPGVRIVKTLSEEVDERDVIMLAAIAEKRSEHPIAQAIVEKAKDMGLTIKDPEAFENIPGQGVIAWIGGRVIAVGNDKLMRGFEIEIEGDVKRISEEIMNEGLTVVYVAIEGRLIGIIGVGDAVRPEAVEVVRRLRSSGYRVIMLTGDKERSARIIASRIGVDDVIAEASPEDKAEAIDRLKSSGGVAMVGDGINDAASLSKADLGIAMGGGTDIAREAGDIILVKEDLRGVVRAIELLKAIRRKIYYNLFWAFIYNVILIPIAAGALYETAGLYLRPELAGIAMAMSSISVTASAQTLKRFSG